MKQESIKKPLASAFAASGASFLGTLYTVLDCQGLCEAMLRRVGLTENLRGSNAWWRHMTWRGTPEACRRRFGCVPPGAFLFIVTEDGGERARGYRDGLGNAVHMGVATGAGKGAIHASQTRGETAESAFTGRSIPGGWNRVGLWDALDYGEKINRLLILISNKHVINKETDAKGSRGFGAPGKTPQWGVFSGERITGGSPGPTAKPPGFRTPGNHALWHNLREELGDTPAGATSPCQDVSFQKEMSMSASAAKTEVEHLSENKTKERAVVTCPEGETVRLRAAPGTGAAVLARVPCGAQVEVTEVGAEWHRVRWKNRQGWMMSAYLTPLALLTTEERVDALERRVEALEEGRG